MPFVKKTSLSKTAKVYKTPKGKVGRNPRKFADTTKTKKWA